MTADKSCNIQIATDCERLLQPIDEIIIWQRGKKLEHERYYEVSKGPEKGLRKRLKPSAEVRSKVYFYVSLIGCIVSHYIILS